MGQCKTRYYYAIVLDRNRWQTIYRGRAFDDLAPQIKQDFPHSATQLLSIRYGRVPWYDD